MGWENGSISQKYYIYDFSIGRGEESGTVWRRHEARDTKLEVKEGRHKEERW